MYMKNLKELLGHFPLIHIATNDDNALILDFYQKIAMKEGNDDIIYERTPNYFSFLKERSDNFLVFIIKEMGTIYGICSISFRDTYLEESKIVIGYIGDLRVHTSKKNTLYWRRFADLFFKFSYNFEETYYCDHYQTALIDSNNFSTRNFLAKGLGEINFKKIASYHMVNYLSPIIPLFFSKEKYTVENASNTDSEIVNNFVKYNANYYDFKYSDDEFLRRIKNWNNFKISDILIVRDKNKNIIAITSLWDPSKTKRIRYHNNSKSLQFLYKYISLFTNLNLPQTKSILNILYLNQFYFHKDFIPPKDFLKNIMRLVYKQRENIKKYNFISYCDFEVNNFHHKLFPDIFLKIPMGLYELRHKSRPEISLKNQSITFEMALV